MGRRIPTDERSPLIHPSLSLSLFVAGMVATVAIITALCSFRRKSSCPPQSPDINTAEKSDVGNATNAEQRTTMAQTTTTTTTSPQQYSDKEDEDARMSKELPLPPGMKYSGQLHSGNLNTTQMKKSASERRLLSNLSVKLPRSLSTAKKDKIKEEYNKRKTTAKLKPEESVWMKTIILGEKCKVPDDDDEPAVIYDAKGRRIPAYHPKSRQSSFIDPSAIPDQRMKKVEIENNINQEPEHKQETKNFESDQE